MEYDPSNAPNKRDLTVLTTELFTELSKTEAEILRLYHIDGLSFGAIGERLGLGRKAVRRLWGRGLKNLHAILDKA